jgi:hypothetical protein
MIVELLQAFSVADVEVESDMVRSGMASKESDLMASEVI